MKDSKRQRIAPIQKNNHLKPNAKGAKHSEARPTAATPAWNSPQRRLRLRAAPPSAPVYLYKMAHTGCVCNSYKLLKGQNIYGIYMTFFKILLELPREYIILVALGARYTYVRFQTYSHPAFGAYYDIFYPADEAHPEGGHQKRVPEEILKASEST